MKQGESTSKAGKTMALIAWIAGLGLLTQFFGVWEERQENPNQNPVSLSISPKNTSVSLLQNRLGHYVVNGELNGRTATYMLDTGATDVVIPEDLADFYQLTSHGTSSSITANGVILVGKTNIEKLSIGDITLYNVRASINPGMGRSQPILLGMSALKQLELRQKEDTLTLIQNH